MPRSAARVCVWVRVRARYPVPRPQERHQEKKNAGSSLAGCLHFGGRMNVPLWLLTAAHLICAGAGALRVSLERQLLEEEISTGRRTCRLYCRVGIGFHLQIHPDGRVNGSHEPNQLSKSSAPRRAQPLNYYTA